MDLLLSRKRSAHAIAGLLALTACAGSMRASNLMTATVSGPVTCSVVTGPGTAATITIKASPALSGTATLAVTFNTPGNGLVVTAPGSTTLNLANNSTGIVYTVNAAPGCAGNGNNTTVIQFNRGGVADITASVVDTVTSPYLMSSTVSGPITCSTATGPGAPATITIKAFTALTGTNTIAVTFATPGNGLVVTAPGTPTLTTANNSSGLVYSVSAAPGCVGNSTAITAIQFSAGGTSDVSASVSDTVTATTSGLVASPSAITVQCALAGTTYTPGIAQTVSITSGASGGTPFSLTTSGGNAPPSWLTLTPSTLTGTATGAATLLSIAATPTAGTTPGCGGFAASSFHTVSLHLASTGYSGLDKLVSVTLEIVAASPLTVTPVPAAPNVSLSYIKGSGNFATSSVNITSSPTNLFVMLNTATLPAWLTVDKTSGNAPLGIRFSTTGAADSMAPGTYSSTVYLQVSGYADTAVPVTLLLNNKAPSLFVNQSTISLNWTIGTPPPTASITATSTDSPISYTIATGGTLAPIIAADQLSGLAYSFGTGIGVTFSPLVFAAAAPGTVLTGTVTFTWGSPVSTTVVTISVTVQSPAATLTGITPGSLPTAPAGSHVPVTLVGSGFVGGSNNALKTQVGIVVGTTNPTLIQDGNLNAVFVNASSIALTITVPASGDAYLLPFTNGTGGVITIGICNGGTASTPCSVPTGTFAITVANGPIVQGVTSSSSFTEVNPPALPTFAPYDMISLFGSNFCASGGTGCGSTTVLLGAPDVLTERYQPTLSPDAAGSTQRQVSVSFYAHPLGAFIGTAPLLFATNSQINALVPAAVSGYVGAETVDVVVSFGYGTSPASTLLQSAPFPVNIAAADPGIFTIGSDGTGSGAVLNGATYGLISGTNPASMRSTGTDSDTVLIYVTGLGAPNSAGDNTTTGAGCIGALTASGTGSYEATLQAATSVSPALANIDGAVIQGALLNTGNLPPCLTSNPTVTIGGVPGNVTYAGFVADTVAGLYQINVQLPSTTGGPFYPNFPSQTVSLTSITAPVQLPVQVTVGTVASQNNVTMWVTPRLKVTDPLGNTTANPLDVISATVGVSYSGTITPTETATGTSYSCSVTSGLLPTGLTLTGNGTVCTLAGKPGANTAGSYTVTVTATDNAHIPLTGTVTFTIQVAGGLYLTSSGTPPYAAKFGTPLAGSPTVTAAGGTYPYTYALSFSDASGNPLVTASTGMAISSGGVLSTTSSTLAGGYNVTVTATDSATPAVTGSITFAVDISLNVTEAAGTGSNLYVVSATGNSGSLTYAISGAGATAGMTVNTSGDVLQGGASGGPFSTTVTVTDNGTLAPGAAYEGTGFVTWSATP